MFKPDKHHLVIAGKTLSIQLILFCVILFVVWGAQKVYSFLDPVSFPRAYQVAVTEGMGDHEKGQQLIDALTARTTI